MLSNIWHHQKYMLEFVYILNLKALWIMVLYFEAYDYFYSA